MDYKLRGYLEETIDIDIDEAKHIVTFLREPEMKSAMMLTEEKDFDVGSVWGMTMKGLQGYTLMQENREATNDESND